MDILEFADVRDARLGEAWDSLIGEGRPNLFVTRSWVTAWADAFADNAEPLMLVGLDGGRPVGLAPLFEYPGSVARFPVNFLSHRANFLVTEPAAASFTSAVLKVLRSRGISPILRGVPAGGVTLNALHGESSGAGFLMLESPGRRSPRIEIADTWEAYLRSRPRKVTHEWERKMRRIEKQGAAIVKSHADIADVTALVDTFIEIDSRSWREEGGTSIRARGAEGFYHAVALSLHEEGMLRPFWLELDGRAVAFLLGAEAGGSFFALKTSFDQDLAGLSPGVPLFHEAVRRSFEEGLSCFDFVGRTARWKEEWANAHLDHSDVRLYPANARGVAAFFVDAHARPLARLVRGVRRR